MSSTLIYKGEPVASSNEILKLLREIDPFEFEDFVADLWEEMGWQTDRGKSKRNDQSVDFYAYRDLPYKTGVTVQVKRNGSNNTVGRPEVQQYSSTKFLEKYDADQVAIVTTGRFTKGAKELAPRLDVKLVNGADLADLIQRIRAEHLIADYHSNASFGYPSYDEIQTEGRDIESQTTGGKEVEEKSTITKFNNASGVGSYTFFNSWTLVILFGLACNIILIFLAYLAETYAIQFDLLISLTFIISMMFITFGIYFEYGSLDQLRELEEPRWMYIIGALIPFFNTLVAIFFLFRKGTILWTNDWEIEP